MCEMPLKRKMEDPTVGGAAAAATGIVTMDCTSPSAATPSQGEASATATAARLPIQMLPEEVVLRIVSNLSDPATLCAVAQTCKNLHDRINLCSSSDADHDGCLWKKLATARWRIDYAPPPPPARWITATLPAANGADDNALPPLPCRRDIGGGCSGGCGCYKSYRRRHRLDQIMKQELDETVRQTHSVIAVSPASTGSTPAAASDGATNNDMSGTTPIDPSKFISAAWLIGAASHIGPPHQFLDYLEQQHQMPLHPSPTDAARACMARHFFRICFHEANLSEWRSLRMSMSEQEYSCASMTLFELLEDAVWLEEGCTLLSRHLLEPNTESVEQFIETRRKIQTQLDVLASELRDAMTIMQSTTSNNTTSSAPPPVGDALPIRRDDPRRQIIAGINQLLTERHKFSGKETNDCEDMFFCLLSVLERQTATSPMLAILYKLILHRVGVPSYIVKKSIHILCLPSNDGRDVTVNDISNNPPLIVDVFAQGHILTVADWMNLRGNRHYIGGPLERESARCMLGRMLGDIIKCLEHSMRPQQRTQAAPSLISVLGTILDKERTLLLMSTANEVDDKFSQFILFWGGPRGNLRLVDHGSMLQYGIMQQDEAENKAERFIESFFSRSMI
jgi:Transglutaminase-like superfamily/F-box-like